MMSPVSTPWWEIEDGEACGRSMIALYKTLESVNTGRQQANLRHLRLYNNQEISGLSVANYVLSTQPTTTNMRQNRLTMNVVKSCIDTLVSKMVKSKIKPTFLTKGGSYDQQKRAQLLNKFTAGLFYKTKLHQAAPMALRDCFIFGDGFIKVYTDQNGELCADRIFPDEIHVDPNDAYYGNPRTLYQRKFVAKDELISMWPEHEEMIRKAPTEQTFRGRAVVECLLVVESWRRASKEGKPDGKHIIAIGTGALLLEDYSRVKFPIATIRYTQQPLGFYGMGVAEELIGIQVELNRILMHVVQCMRLISNPRVFVEAGSAVNTNQLTNEIGGVVEYTGQPPIFMTPQSVSPEYFSQMENLYRKAYEIVGVSSLSAQSKNPLGSNASGKALREMSNIESERFMLTGQAYENFHMDVAELMLDEVRHSKKSVEVKSFNRKDGLEVISSADLDLSDDGYVMQVFPTSALPDTPSARLQTITEMMQSGLIDPEDGQELLDFPDLDARSQIQNSPIRLIRKQIESMLDSGKLIMPEPYDNLLKARSMATMYYNYARLADVEEERLDVLRQYIDAVQDLIQQSEQASQPAAPAQALLESQLAAPLATQAVPGSALPPVI